MEPKLIISKQILLDNQQRLRASMPNSQIYAVVKGNGYGLGLHALASLLNETVDGFCVGLESEAINLSEDPHVTKPILLMSPVFDPDKVRKYGYTPAVESVAQLQSLEKLGAAEERVFPYHLKVETGLHRFGLPASQLNTMANAIKASKWTKLEGVFSHFQSVSDALSVKAQLHEFLACTTELESAGISIPMKHIANGEAGIDYPETRLDLIRVGNALFGKARTRTDLGLKRPERLEVPIVKIQDLPAGKLVGYSGSYKTKRATRIGLIPFGFDDGLKAGRKLSPLSPGALFKELARITVRYFKPISPVVYQGKSVPLLGREYMQFATIDLTQYPEIQVGDKVEIEMSSFFISSEIERIYQ